MLYLIICKKSNDFHTNMLSFLQSSEISYGNNVFTRKDNFL